MAVMWKEGAKRRQSRAGEEGKESEKSARYPEKEADVSVLIKR